jgi:processive 1,2-diacylglycerol beta-glucosyltransferase
MMPMIQLTDSETGRLIGTISEKQLQFLIDQLEEESSSDRDYYIDGATIEMLEASGGEPELTGLLRGALASREGFEFRWSPHPSA